MPKPDNFLKEMREAAAKKALPPVDVKSGPEAERYPGDEFTVAQASTPAGGETMPEAAMGHTLNPEIERDTWQEQFEATFRKRYGEDAHQLYGEGGKFSDAGIIPADSEFARMYRAMDPYDEDIREAYEGRRSFGEEFPAHKAAAEKEHEARGVPYPARDEAREKRVVAQKKARGE